ncbi:MAG: 2-dehydropantoate 2-reductase [Chloroflexi bacterium]|nr:2-dehydropantoate 2-reductase [Chloroflexota bacterium]
MRVMMMGSGGVGGFVGAGLFDTGHDVTFVARGAHLEAIREHGLCMLSEDGSRRFLQVDVVERPADAGATFDLIVFAVKAYDTQSAAELLVPAVGDETAVLTLQNGIDSVPMLSSVLGAEHVIGGATWLTAHIAGPGVIEYQDALVRAAIGEPGGGISDRVETIAEALRGCGIETEVSDDITRILWSKIVLLSVHGGMSAACQLPLGDILSTEGMEDVYRKMFNEAASVGRALGVDLPESTSDDLVALLQSAPADNTTSLQVDFGHQRRVELEYLTGAVVRRGREAGVPTPALEAIYLSLKAKARAVGGV